MAAPTKNVLWINDFSGSVNQASASHFLAENQFKSLVNMSQTEVGAIAHRLGSELFLELISGTGLVQELHMYEKADSSFYLHLVEGGNLRVSDETNSQWDLQEAAVWATDSLVDMTNFLNRHYMIGNGATEYLRYATNSGNTSVVTGDITGEFLAINGPYLMVVDPPNNKAKWSGVASDTFDAADYYSIHGLATGVGSFGIGRPFVVFTNQGYTVIDPAQTYFAEVRDFGCVSHRSIQAIRGYLIYLGRGGIYMLGYNDSFPVEISRLVRNEQTQDAYFNQIDPDNWGIIGSGVIDDRYFLALRDLSGEVLGQDLDSVLLEYDVSQKTMKSHTFADGGLATVLAQFIDSDGNRDLYAGSCDDKAVYKMLVEDTYTDDDSSGDAQDVTATAITKDYEFYRASKKVVVMQTVKSLHFKYKADSALTVKYSLDGNPTYSDAPITLPATEGNNWEQKEMRFGKDCKSISLEISGTGDFIIYGIGFEVTSEASTGISVI